MHHRCIHGFGNPSIVGQPRTGEMKYIAIETFRPNCKTLVYERFRENGRMLPDGLRYVDSWLEKEGDRCFQLMETDLPERFETWIAAWSDLVSFEIIELENQDNYPGT